MRYDLYLGSLRVGTVTEHDKDFPNLWGQITYDESVLNPSTEATTRLAKFIDLSCESIGLADVEQEQDVAAKLAVMNKQLEQFQDYIDTDDWVLIDDNGQRHWILCPILRLGREIVWRWSPRG